MACNHEHCIEHHHSKEELEEKDDRKKEVIIYLVAVVTFLVTFIPILSSSLNPLTS